MNNFGKYMELQCYVEWAKRNGLIDEEREERITDLAFILWLNMSKEETEQVLRIHKQYWIGKDREK